MKTIILSSKELSTFIVFESNKSPKELIKHIQGLEFSQEQATFKALAFAHDLETIISCEHTYASNKNSQRFIAVISKEKEGYSYIGNNRGTEEFVAMKESEYSIASISALSSLFIVIFHFAFWVVILASLYVGYTVDVLTGSTMAVAAIVSFGLIFILADLLKNTVQINRKLIK